MTHTYVVLWKVNTLKYQIAKIKKSISLTEFILLWYRTKIKNQFLWAFPEKITFEWGGNF